MNSVQKKLALRTDSDFLPRYDIFTDSQVRFISCKTVCIGKMIRRSHFTLAWKWISMEKSVTVVRNSRTQVCRQNLCCG